MLQFLPLSELNVTVSLAPGAPLDNVDDETVTDSVLSNTGSSLKAVPISDPSAVVRRGSEI